MRIFQEGDITREKKEKPEKMKKYIFHCSDCGCIFEETENNVEKDVRYDKGCFLGTDYTSINVHIWHDCPCCSKILCIGEESNWLNRSLAHCSNILFNRRKL